VAAPTFADVVAGRTPVHVVAEDEAHVAFLAPRPHRPGHVIVTTRTVVDQLFDLPSDAHAALWAFVREVALRMRARLPCERVCVSVIGWVVRHAHVHLVPTTAIGQVPGLDGEPLAEAEMLAIAQRLRGGDPDRS
jgi:histidine triad (HIT) family protein